MSMIRKWLLMSVLALVVMFAVGACGVDNPTVTPTARNSIVICIGEEPASLYLVTGASPASIHLSHVMDGLGWYNDDAYFYGTRMLEEFPSFDNGGVNLENDILAVTFTFKEGITWSDGTPFSVDDILFTRDVVLNSGLDADEIGILDQLSLEKIDDHTLKVTYPEGVKDPQYFLPPLSSPSAEGGTILPRHILENVEPAEIPNSEFARGIRPVLGPYQLVEWEAGDHLTFKAVDHWWGGEIRIPNLIYRFIPDANQLMPSLLAGECDYGTSDVLTLTQLPRIQESVNKGLLKVHIIPSAVWERVDFNTMPVEGVTPFFADVRVRQAVAYGFNRPQVIEKLLHNAAVPLDSYLPADHWAANSDTVQYNYDPDKARSLLAEAGWTLNADGVLEASAPIHGEYSCGRGTWSIPSGTQFEVTLSLPEVPTMRQQLASIFKSNMADLGIRVKINLVSNAGELFGEAGALNHRTFDLTQFAWIAGVEPASIVQYAGINIYTWQKGQWPDLKDGPSGPLLTADALLAQNPNLLTGTGIDNETFAFRQPDSAVLPDGLTLLYPAQIPSVHNGYEGANVSGWCNSTATQAMGDGDYVIDPARRISFHQVAQKYFMEDLPSMPLFHRVEVEASSPSLCGPDKGPLNYVSWNVETWYFDETGACGE